MRRGGPWGWQPLRKALLGVGDVNVVVSTFEQWEGNGQRFDLVVAATSWHWLDARDAYRRAAEMLRDDGPHLRFRDAP